MSSQREFAGRDQRMDERHNIHLDATIRAYRMTPLSAALVDVSAGGAMLEGDHPDLMIGDEVTVDAGAFEAVATVAWSREAFFGVSFHRHLAEWQIKGIRRSGNA